jgi:predicted amidophosphoribosyltransferase
VTATRCCPVCGQSLTDTEPAQGTAGPGGSCPNRWCRRPGRAFSVAFSVGVYQGALRQAIHRYKYRGDQHLAPAFAAMVARYLAAHPVWFEEFTVLTGVPSYTGPGARRGWDPVGGILAALADGGGRSGGARSGGGWSVRPGLIAKTAETPGMTGLGWRDRQLVARGPLRRSLCAATGSLRGAQVLLFDDVMTEGGTLNEVATALRRAGASDVAALVLARPAWTVTRVQM